MGERSNPESLAFESRQGLDATAHPCRPPFPTVGQRCRFQASAIPIGIPAFGGAEPSRPRIPGWQSARTAKVGVCHLTCLYQYNREKLN